MKYLISPLIAALMLFVLMPDVLCTEARAASEALKYDDGTREDGIRPWSDEVGSEVAVRFTPSSYPVILRQVRFFVSGSSGSAASTLFEVRIYDDDNGSYPGTRLNGAAITASANNANEWVIIDVSQQNIMINEGDFFVSMYWLAPPGSAGQNETQVVGLDTNTPIDGRSYVKWGGSDSWYGMSSTPGGDRDVMIRAVVQESNLFRVKGIPVLDITVDGNLSDWGNVPPTYVDDIGDNTTAHAGCDLKNVYVATNSDRDRLYVALEMTEPPNNENGIGGEPLVGYLIQFDDYTIESSGTTYHDWQTGIDRANNFWIWDLQKANDYDDPSNCTSYGGSGNTVSQYQQDEVIEFSFPTSLIGSPDSFAIYVYLWLRDGQNTNPDVMAGDLVLTFDPSVFSDWLETISSLDALLTWMKANIKYGWPMWPDMAGWRYKAPDEVFFSKIGECVSQSGFEAYVLGKIGYHCSLLWVDRKHPTICDHAVCYLRDADGFRYFEHAHHGFEGIHGPFPAVQKIGEDVNAHLRQGDEGEWVRVDLSPQNITINEGDFFVSMVWLTAPGTSGENAQFLAHDNSPPIDNRTSVKWGASGVWGFWAQPADAMMRATVGGWGHPSPTILQYDDDTKESERSPWTDETASEVAVRFTPTHYPATLWSVDFFVGLGGKPATPFEVRVYDDDNGVYPGSRMDHGGLSGATMYELFLFDNTGYGVDFPAFQQMLEPLKSGVPTGILMFLLSG